MSRLAAIRYLASILQLVNFWNQRIYKDCRPYEAMICKITHSPEDRSSCKDPHSHKDIKCSSDLHSFVNMMCKIGINLLKDFSAVRSDDRSRRAVTQNELAELIPFDSPGTNLLLWAFWERLPLALPFFDASGDRADESWNLMSELREHLQRLAIYPFMTISIELRHIIQQESHGSFP